MQNVLADLCVEAEAHTLTAFHMASAFDKYYSGASEDEKEVFRLGVSVGKYYVTKVRSLLYRSRLSYTPV